VGTRRLKKEDLLMMSGKWMAKFIVTAISLLPFQAHASSIPLQNLLPGKCIVSSLGNPNGVDPKDAGLARKLCQRVNDAIDAVQAHDYERANSQLTLFKAEGLARFKGGDAAIPKWAKELSDKSNLISAQMALAPVKKP
jgi:hypothetical protein